MRPFQLTTASDLSGVVTALSSDPSARVIAGGTTLLDLMKLDVETPAHLIDITRLGETASAIARVARLPDGGIRLGALTRNSDVAHDPAVRDAFPLLSQALLAGASGQIRNMATTAGNLLQRTRCYYFRDTTLPCNKREPGTGCPALGGQNRIHAILGVSRHCIATHPSDMCVALSALDAQIRIQGTHGERVVPIGDFLLVPGDHPERENVLEPGDIVIAIDIPALPFAKRSAYVKIRDRASYAFALASAAVALDLVDGRIRAARIALGGVATTPWRVPAAEAVLVGQAPSEAAWQQAAAVAIAGAEVQPGNAFKVPLIRRTLMRTLAQVAALA